VSDDRAPKPIDFDLPPLPAKEDEEPAAASPPPPDFNPFATGAAAKATSPLDEPTSSGELPVTDAPTQSGPVPPTEDFNFNPFTREIKVPVGNEPLRSIAEAPAVQSPFVDEPPRPTTPPPSAPASFSPPAPSQAPPPAMANPFATGAAASSSSMPAPPPPAELPLDALSPLTPEPSPPPPSGPPLPDVQPTEAFHRPPSAALANPFAKDPSASSPSMPASDGAPLIAGAPRPSTGDGPDAQIRSIVSAFEELQRGVKRLVFNKHRIDEYSQYLSPAYEQLKAVIDQRGRLDLRTEVSTLVVGDVPVLEDDKRENNLIYPLWNEGVRLLLFKEELTLQSLLKFITTVLDVFPRDPSEDLLSALWKAELPGIEWVALDDFSLVESDGDNAEEVEVQVEEILAFLQRQLSSDQGDGVAHAKVNLNDLELQLNDVQALKQLQRGGPLYSAEYKAMIQQELGTEEARLLDKICAVIFEVMRLPATDEELEDIAAALEQLLDGLVLQGKFGTINRVISFAEGLAYEAGATTANRDLGRRISDRLSALIAQPERVRAVATALNAGRVGSLDELKAYLERLGPHAVVMLLEMMDMIQNPLHRRAVSDALVELGRNAVPLFAGRIKKASSNLAKDLFYIIDCIDPPDKATILEPILNHENAVLRMEVMNLLSKARDERALGLVIKVFKDHPIPQMRAHAARVMGQFPERMVVEKLVKAARDPGFDERPPLEQRAVIATLSQMEHPSAKGYINGIIGEKSGLLKSRKVDERKLLLIKALSSYAGIPALKALSDIAGNKSMHSKEVLEAARDAALKMRDRLQGQAPP
jgi:hypothetical protein